MNIISLFNASGNDSVTHASHRGLVLVVVESCIFVVLNITAVVGNLLVCVAFYRNVALRTVTNNFILSLALTDLLMAVFVMPLATSSSFADRWVAGEFGLEVHGYCGLVASGTSLLTVMLLAINRYFRVVKPVLYRNIYSKKTSAFMAVAAWIVTTVVICVSLSLVGARFEISRLNPAAPLTVVPDKHAFYYNLMRINYLIFPSLAVIICYLKIYQIICQHNSAAAPSSQGGHSSYGVEEAKMTRLLTVVVVCFYLCWAPIFAVIILISLKQLEETTSKYQYFYYIYPAYVSSAINPIVYGIMNQSFRAEFLKIIRH